MNIRKAEESRDIETKEASLRLITGKSMMAGSLGYSLVSKSSQRKSEWPEREVIRSMKNALRKKDVRKQLAYLSPEQRRQWNSYSYRKQTQILEKAERLAKKQVSRKQDTKKFGKNAENAPAIKLTKAKILEYVLNGRAKGNAITNVRGTGDKWEVQVLKGDTAKKMKKNLEKGSYETVTFYTDNVRTGDRKVKKLEKTYRRAQRAEKRETKAYFLSVFSRLLTEEAGQNKALDKMQEADQAAQMRKENETAYYIFRTSLLPVRARIQIYLGRIGKKALYKAARFLGGALMGLLGVLLPLFLIIGIAIALTSMLDLDGAETYGGGNDIIQVAMQEEGNVNGEKYWRFMGSEYRIPWCACFVSWCGNELGYQQQGIMPSSAACDDFRNFYRSQNRLQPGLAHGGSYIPKAGDLVLFQWDGIMSDSVMLDHIGIVTSCDGLTVNTIEGNTSNMVAQRSYSLGDASIIWYCTPAYPAGGLGGTGEGGHAMDGTEYTEEQLQLIWAIVAQEDNGSYDGALAVITCAMNRVESARWQSCGSNALEQLTAPGQFCYSNDTFWHQWLGGNVPEYVKQAVNDCLKKGIRNHDFTCFRSTKGSETGANAEQIGGNWFFSPK